MTDVFISHAKADRKLLRRIVKALEAEGFDLWWDQNSAADGKWTPALQRALVDSAAVLACWSEESVQSEWVKAEASHGKDRNALIALKINECKIPAPFRDLGAPDFAKWRGQTDDPDWIAIVARVRELIKAKAQIGTQAPAPPQVVVPAAPVRPAPPPPPEPAQVVAPSAFFSANLGAVGRGAAGRASPLPQAPPQRARPAPPAEPPRPAPAPPPRLLRPEPPPAAPPRIHPIETPPPAAPRGSVHPIDAPRGFKPIDEPAAAPPRPAPRSTPAPAPAPAPRAVARPEPLRQREPAPVETVRRKRGGAAQFMTLLLVAGAVIGGGYWASQQFLSPPSAPATDEAANTPEPLPLDAPAQTDLAAVPAEDLPPEPEAAAADPVVAPPAPAVQTATAARQPPAQTPRTTPPRAPAQTPPRTNAALVIPPTTDNGAAAAMTEAEATRQLERCLGRLVRLCPGGANVSRPGFTEDGTLSSAERALLRQRALFDFSEVMSANVQNCQRHLNAGQTPALTQACSALPTAGPPN